MANFSTSWKKSKKPGKQRKYRKSAPGHIRHKFVKAHLSKDLRKKYGKRNLTLKKGDAVKVMRGGFKNHQGKIEKIDMKSSDIFVSGVESTKKDGTKVKVALDPSNLMIVELNLEDKLRQKAIERKK